MVLGPWLAALDAQRPRITWPYVIGGGSITALPWTAPDAGNLRADADAILHEDSRVTEAVPAAHGDGMLSITAPQAGGDAARGAALLYQGGIRRLILSGGPDTAAPFLTGASSTAFMPTSRTGRPPGSRTCRRPGRCCRPGSRSPR
jgi:hypothetical protein